MVHHRVEDIDTTELVTIASDGTVETALKAMSSTGDPQIGVDGTDGLEGIVTHRSINRAFLILSNSGAERDFLERRVTLVMEELDPVVGETADVFTLFEELVDSPYVLVDCADGYEILRDVGFHQYLQEEIEAFMLIEEIERSIRNFFQLVFGDELAERLQTTFEDKEIRVPSSIEECTFAHYQIFLSVHWDAFEDYFDEDRAFVRELLNDVGDIRNALFHFRTEDRQKVEEREFLMFVRKYFNSEIAPRVLQQGE